MGLHDVDRHLRVFRIELTGQVHGLAFGSPVYSQALRQAKAQKAEKTRERER
jgi:hypothetical protein